MLDILHACAALGHDSGDHANKVNRDVDGELLKWLLNAVRPLMQEHLRARDFKFKPFASHLLNKDGELEFAASAYLEGFTGLSWAHLNRRVAEHLLFEARLQLA